MKVHRFTLVELMIVVAIVLVLAAIAIPQFNTMQLRAKRGEAEPNLDGIVTAVVAYHAATDRYPPMVLNPATGIGKTLKAWPTNTLFASIGWAPDGQVRANYQMQGLMTDPGSCDATLTSVACTEVPDTGSRPCASAATDVDGDGVANCAYLTLGGTIGWARPITTY